MTLVHSGQEACVPTEQSDGPATHTKGLRIIRDGANPSDARLTSDERTHVAKVYASSAASDPVCEANARLFAAAPHLLATVSLCRQIFADYAEMHRHKLNAAKGNDTEFQAVLRKVERNAEMADVCIAAIAQATEV